VLSLIFMMILCLEKLDAQESPAVSARDYSGFKVIAERNIFNPNRARRAEAGAPSAREADTRRVTTEALALIGTMSYEKGRFAIFDGTSPQYRIMLQPNGTIAGHTIAEVGVDHVGLEKDGKRIELAVGMQMMRHDEGAWAVSDREEPWRGSAGSNGSRGSRESRGSDRGDSSGSGGSDAGGESRPESAAEESDLLKRLMQQREQELTNEK
jgi:hypothetical protein